MIDLAKREAKSLRTLLMPSEKAKLNFDNLNAFSQHNCIYGLATGNCNSLRAQELIQASCQRVYSVKQVMESSLKEAKLNGKPIIILDKQDKERRDCQWMSSLELLIMEEDYENNKNLLNYIKGVKKTLQIK